MLRVHQTRMDRLKYPVAETVNPNLLVPYSSRLPSKDPGAIAEARQVLRKEDHAPFTIDRQPDHDEFLRAFRTQDDAGKNLRSIEIQAYFKTLQTPSLVRRRVDESSFERRTLKRGRRRANIQTVLQVCAGNSEQCFEGGWMHRVVTLPKPPPLAVEEPRMFQAPVDGEREQEPDAFEWTKKNMAFQQDQLQIEEWVNTERVEAGGDTIALDDKSTLRLEPFVFYKPTQKRGVVKARLEKRLIRLTRVTLAIIAQIASDDYSRSMQGEEPPSTFEALVMLQAIRDGIMQGSIEDLSTASRVTIIHRYVEAGGQLLAAERDDGSGNAPLADAELAHLEACTAEALSMPSTETADLLTRLSIELFDLIETVQGKYSTGSDGTDSVQTGNGSSANDQKRQALIDFREELADDTSTTTRPRKFISLQEMAQPLGGKGGKVENDELPDIELAKNLLTDRILTENHHDRPTRKLQHDKLWSFTYKLPQRSKAMNFFSMEKWLGPPPFDPRKAGRRTTDSSNASTSQQTNRQAKLLRNAVKAAAGTGTKRKATSDPNTTPAPKRSQHAVDYRSLAPDDTNPSRRLAPEEIGFSVIDEDSHEIVPKVGSGQLMPPEIRDFDIKRHGQVLENAPDPKEKRLKGPPRFPFAETSTTAAVMNQQIKLDLRDGKEFCDP